MVEADFRTVGVSPAMVRLDAFPGDVYRSITPDDFGNLARAFVWGVSDDGRLLMSRFYQNQGEPERFVATLPDLLGEWTLHERNPVERGRVAVGR